MYIYKLFDNKKIVPKISIGTKSADFYITKSYYYILNLNLFVGIFSVV